MCAVKKYVPYRLEAASHEWEEHHIKSVITRHYTEIIRVQREDHAGVDKNFDSY